jgi:hypothetical protein
MSSDDYFDRLDTLKQVNREFIDYDHSHERRLRGRWDYSKPPKRLTSVVNDLFGGTPTRVYGGWVPPIRSLPQPVMDSYSELICRYSLGGASFGGKEIHAVMVKHGLWQ